MTVRPATLADAIDEGHFGDDAEKELRRHVGDGAHQHAARASAVGDDAAACSETLLGEKLTGRDEIGEAVDLLLPLAVLVPAIALVLAAAHMGNGIDEAAIHKAKRVGGEA